MHGNSICNGNISITGGKLEIVGGDIECAGNIWLGSGKSLNTDGLIKGGSLSITGNASIGGTLSITDDFTLTASSNTKLELSNNTSYSGSASLNVGFSTKINGTLQATSDIILMDNSNITKFRLYESSGHILTQKHLLVSLGNTASTPKVRNRLYYLNGNTKFPGDTDTYDVDILIDGWHPSTLITNAGLKKSFQMKVSIYKEGSANAVKSVTVSKDFTSGTHGNWIADDGYDYYQGTVKVSMVKGAVYSITCSSVNSDSSFISADATITLKSIYTSTGTNTVAITSDPEYIYAGQTIINAVQEWEPQYEILLGACGTNYASLSSATSNWVITSDGRDKTDFKDITNPLEFINELKPVRYLNNSREKYVDDNGVFDEEAHQNAILCGNRRQVGFIAQDVYDSMKKVYRDDNYANIVDYNGYGTTENKNTFDRYSMCYDSLIPFLTGAIQELSKKNDTLVEEIQHLKEELTSLKTQENQ